MAEQESSPELVGNRLVLAGAVIYLLEWIAIIGASVDAPFVPGTSSAKVFDGYVGNAGAYGWAAGFWSVVLLGRILIVVGLGKGLDDSSRPHPLNIVAVAAMTASVIIEIVTYGIVAGTAVVADHGGTPGLVKGLDSVANSMSELIFGPLGVAVLAASWAMLRSGLFSRILCGVGMLGGTMCTVFGLAFNGPNAPSVAGAFQAGIPLFWIWMLWAGVVMWRRAPDY